MEFVWDTQKAVINKRKHGVSFEEAQTVFQDCDALRIFDPDHSEDEDRFLLLGLSSVLRLLVVCHCYRENDKQIRIISARKASKSELTFTYTLSMRGGRAPFKGFCVFMRRPPYSSAPSKAAMTFSASGPVAMSPSATAPVTRPQQRTSAPSPV